ncbi:MAG: hypothetical protein WBP59_05150 [Ilumatobacteraceae bacterium]
MLLLVVIASVVGAVPGAVASASGPVPTDAAIGVGIEAMAGASAELADTVRSAPPVARGIDTASFDSGQARGARVDHRGGHPVAGAISGIPRAVDCEFRHRVESVTNSWSGGPGRDTDGRAPPVDPG